MTCFYPLDGWRAERVNPETGKRPIVFKPHGAIIDQTLSVPCGKCTGCAADKAQEWGIRCYHESLIHNQNSFITLTYDDDHLPGALVKDHLKEFVNKLKAEHPIRYFGVGEYGDTTHRPHYHLLVFGQDYLGTANHLYDTHFHSQWLTDQWSKGMVDLGLVEPASCFYVAGYASKKINDPDTFNLMTTKPGIGKEAAMKYYDSWQSGQLTIDGVKRPVPKRYFQWLEEELQPAKEARQAYVDSLDPLHVRDKKRSREINLAGRNKSKGKI